MAPRDYGSLPVTNLKIFTKRVEEDPKRDTTKSSVPRHGKRIGCIVAAVALLTLAFRFTGERNQKGLSVDSTSVDGGGGGLSARSLTAPEEMGFPVVMRSEETSPGPVWGSDLLKGGGPLPTNIWYLNLLSKNAGTSRATEANRVYTVPYILDTVGPIVGMRLHWPTVQASDRNVQMVYDAENGLTVGTADAAVSREYRLEDDPSPLGLSLRWDGDGKGSMTARIVRGMPFATLEYRGGVNPVIASGELPADPPLIDRTANLTCVDAYRDGRRRLESETGSPELTAEREVLLHFKESDFTWIVFFSRPVLVKCSVTREANGPGLVSDTAFQMHVKDLGGEEGPLIVRTGMLNQCTTGKSVIAAHCADDAKMKDPEGYLAMLRESAMLYPGTPKLGVDFSSSRGGSMSAEDSSRVTFDWDVQTVPNSEDANPDSKTELLMFALPHHQDILESIDGVSSNAITHHCTHTFHGSTCLVKGNKWSLVEQLGSPQSFDAQRPPEASAIPDLAQAVAHDLKYQLSDNLRRGAADTYFSGKILARMGRVLLIASELKGLAASDGHDNEEREDPERHSRSIKASKNVTLPTDDKIADALDNLRSGVEVWINGTAEAGYVHDKTWGGLVNCGCTYEGEGDKGFCSNSYPDCPALTDVNVDFGNGFYNDHHFHYGYHIYSAAVVAHLDPQWGRTHFDRVMLYVRDIANPNGDDAHFPRYRHKDWYLGSSWASGFISANTAHGRNQESSTEAIAAYEAVTMFGDVMMDAFCNVTDRSRRADALEARDAGRLLTAMEVKATQRYWHVWSSPTHVNTYPPEYKEPVVGMLYETMASFQTWFSGGDMASFGIQLLPFTPVAERRDDPQWAAVLYPAYKKSCLSEEQFCVENGWVVMLCGLIATIGDREEALQVALSIPEDVFHSEGGNGHSRTNTIWYISTRPDVNLNQTAQGSFSGKENEVTDDLALAGLSLNYVPDET